MPMCASYMIKARNPQQIGIPVDQRIDDFEQFSDQLIVPHRPAPVIKAEGEKNILTTMRFSLLPSWSKEPKVKFATHNARLESIDEKPTWRTVFARNHCVVPLSGFIEPIYEGEYAGHMVSFARQDGELLYAAGVWDEWVNKETGEIIPSFSIITFDPPQFVATVGHDRCPVFLSEDRAQEWLHNGGEKSLLLKDFLLNNRLIPDFGVQKFRAMRPGWEKRK